jgi:hypothetical protein
VVADASQVFAASAVTGIAVCPLAIVIVHVEHVIVPVPVIGPPPNGAVVVMLVTVPAPLAFNCVWTELVASMKAIVAALTPFVEVGVIAPKDRVIAGVVAGLATVPETPFAVATETVVTVPPPPPPPPKQADVAGTH